MKIEAFTIIETITAMLIIMISFSAAMLFYLSMLQGDAFPLKTKANTILELVYAETKNAQRFIDEEVQREDLFIAKKVLPYTIENGLGVQQVYQVNLKAITPNQEIIAEHNHLIQVAYEK